MTSSDRIRSHERHAARLLQLDLFAINAYGGCSAGPSNVTPLLLTRQWHYAKIAKLEVRLQRILGALTWPKDEAAINIIGDFGVQDETQRAALSCLRPEIFALDRQAEAEAWPDAQRERIFRLVAWVTWEDHQPED